MSTSSDLLLDFLAILCTAFDGGGGSGASFGGGGGGNGGGGAIK